MDSEPALQAAGKVKSRSLVGLEGLLVMTNLKDL